MAAKRDAGKKRSVGKAPLPGHVPSARVVRRAEAMAKAMPLVHYPASARVAEWSKWSGLQSKAARGLAPAPGRFGQLRDSHVFVYGGPCCYYQDNCIGDAVIYFAPAAEKGRKGGATPFDSGSLEDSPPRLQPFRRDDASEDKRWRFFAKHQVSLDAWRARFGEWLAFAYDDPDRYMESSSNRYAAGQPDRTEPRYLLNENGVRGVNKYGVGNCGDRRAWTWEVRIEASLPFEDIAVLHVPFDAFEQVADFADEVEQQTGVRPAVETLPRDMTASFQAFYEESGTILKGLVNT